ncbi:LOW QUALITY PROTEIN: asparagine synthetase [Bacillus sp. JCM 19046]|nr:LOW QUALITY PROTEIN: asparagine synthetase [Bacillus sp. JCM 19046]
MCGFVGFKNTITNNIEQNQIIKNMADQIIHRGPDDEAYYTDQDIALGFRRLSIIDLDHGKQPLFNEDESMVLVFNGEIYNYQELRTDLIEKGHQFTTESDSEVLIHGYEEYGTMFLEKLRGMFAFVIWDKNEEKLFGARDIFGIKPFFILIRKMNLFSVQKLKGLLPHPHFKKTFNEEFLPEYLSFEYIPTNETLFKDVYSLLPGHYFEYKKGDFQTYPYHTVNFTRDDSQQMDQYVDQIVNTFRDSVKHHQVSDVEVGAFLSGGIDSSYVLNEVAKESDVKSFSVGYEESKYSELGSSSEFAKVIGVRNYETRVSAEQFFNAVPNVQYYMDEPLPNPSAIPLYYLAEEASKHVKVVLSGEGADELFGGYNQYKEAAVFERYERIPLAFRKLAGKVAEKLPKMKGVVSFCEAAQSFKERYFRIDYVFSYEDRARLLKNKSLNRDCKAIVGPIFDQVSHLDAQSQMQYFDIQAWLNHNILVKADRMSMAISLELRVPFLDKEMLNIALRIPSEYRVTKEQTKVALRKAAIRELPEQTANRRKLGFPSPLAQWLKEDAYFQMVKDQFLTEAANHFFEQNELLALLEEHRQEGHSNMQKIWSVYSFLVWYEIYFGTNPSWNRPVEKEPELASV